MKTAKHLSTFALCLFIQLVLCAENSLSQSSQDDLTGRTVDLQLKDATLHYALSKLCVRYGVPVGLELSAAHQDKAHLNIDIRHAPLRDALDLITQQEPAYRWEINDGVIKFVPTHSRDPLLEKLLETPVRRFSPLAGSTRSEILEALAQLSEVRALLVAHKTSISNVISASAAPRVKWKEEIDSSISDTNVKGLLNKIVRDSDAKLWVMRRVGADGGSIQISF